MKASEVDGKVVKSLHPSLPDNPGLLHQFLHTCLRPLFWVQRTEDSWDKGDVPLVFLSSPDIVSLILVDVKWNFG